LGNAAQGLGGNCAAAIPLFRRAVNLDPNFAMAFVHLGMCYSNMGQTVRGTEYLQRAYELRERLHGRERFYIPAFYEIEVTGNLEAARKALDHVLQSGSTSGPHGEPIFYSAEEVPLRAPIAPKKFFHAAGFQNVDAIIGHEEPVIYPEHLTQELDCEIELAVVLKKNGKHFAPEDAASYIGGYVIFNEITARDIQRREMKSGILGVCKGIDTFCPLGPWIVTADEIPNPQNLAMELRVNGEPRQNSSGKMLVKIPEILSRYSPMGYSAGDVLSTGTSSNAPAFNGDRKVRYLKVGDVMECEIEGIGILRNRVISWEEAHGRKPAALATQETSS